MSEEAAMDVCSELTLWYCYMPVAMFAVGVMLWDRLLWMSKGCWTTLKRLLLDAGTLWIFGVVVEHR